MSVERSALSVERSAAVAVTDADNPWPGLSSFTEDTRGFFYGRDTETDELSRLVRRETLTVLFGQSGLGKSSLLQAALFPLLRETDHLPLYLRLDHAAAAPALAEQVKSALNAAFADAKADAPPLGPKETLWEYFHRKDVDIWSAKNRLLTPVLAFDQFEEIFTLGRADEARRERSRAFLTELADLVENRPPAALREKFDRGEADPTSYNFDKPSCRVILSLREDFLPDLEGLKQALPALIHNRLRLKRLNGAQALEAVARPAPHLLADGVGEKIVEFVAGARGGSAERLLELEVEPALLSVICRELNERRRSLGQEKITADLVSGNRREILTDFYERSVGDLPEGMRAFVEDHLLTKSGFRDNLALETALEFPGVTRPLIDTLVARRLLRLEDRLGVQRVELTHDVLADVVKASRDARQQRLALEEAAMRQRHALAEATRRARRMRFAIAGLGLAVIGLSIGAVFGIRAQKHSAAQASRTDLVLGSRLLDEGKLEEGLAYLVRSGRKDPHNRLIAPRLLTALTSRNFMLPVGAPLSLGSPVVNGDASADGRWIVAETEDGAVHLLDVEKWQIVRTLSFQAKLRRGGVAFPEGNSELFGVALEDNTLVLCSSTTGEPLRAPLLGPVRFGSANGLIQFSRDGKWVGAAGAGEIWVWNTATGEKAMSVPCSVSFRGFAFSPDGTKLAATAQAITQMWSVPSQQPVGSEIASDSPVIYPRFSADGSKLVIWNFNGVLVCDGHTGAVLRPLIPLNGQAIYHITLTPDGSRLVHTATNRKASVLDLTTGNPVFADLPHGGNAPWVQLVDQGRVLLTNSVDGYFRMWNLETGTLLAAPTMKQPRLSAAIATPDGRGATLLTADGRAFKLRLGRGAATPLALPRSNTDTLFVNLTASSPTGLVWLTHTEAKVIDVASGRLAPGGFRFPERLVNAARSGYGATLGPGDVVGARLPDRSWRLWTLGESGIARDVPLALEADTSIGSVNAVDSKLRRLPLAVGRGAARIDIFDTQTGQRATTLKRAPGSVSNTMSFSSDGKHLAYRTISDGVVHVCHVDSGQEVFSLQPNGKTVLTSVRYSPDGRHLLTGDDWGAVQVWEATAGKLVQTLQTHRSTVTRFDFSSDRRHYASVSEDGSVQVWDAMTHRRLGELLEQSGSASRADFSPDSKRIATPANTGSARVWDVQTGLPVTDPLTAETDPVSVVAYSADGRFLDVHAYATIAKQHVRVFAAPPPDTIGRTPDWLLTLALICGGQRFDESGKLVSAIDELAKIDDVQRALAAAPADDIHAQWARWFLSDDPNRSIAPGFTITPAEAKKLREAVPTTPASTQ